MRKEELTEWKMRELDILSKEAIIDTRSEYILDLTNRYHKRLPTTPLEDHLYWERVRDDVQEDRSVISIYRNLRYPYLYKKEHYDLNYCLLEKPKITDRKRIIWENLIPGEEKHNLMVKDFLMNYLDEHFPIYFPYDPIKIKYQPAYMVIKQDRNNLFLNFLFLMKIEEKEGKQERTVIKINRQFLLNEDHQFLEISDQWESIRNQFVAEECDALMEEEKEDD